VEHTSDEPFTDPGLDECLKNFKPKPKPNPKNPRKRKTIKQRLGLKPVVFSDAEI